MDRRQKKTRQAIFQAFTKLLEEKPYSAITVQQIIDKADVGRSTFYAHFETKDDLLEALCSEIFDHVFAHDLKKEPTHDFSGGNHGLEERIKHILYHIRDSRSYIKGILARESDELFMRYFKQHLKEVLEETIQDGIDDIPKSYILNQTVCGFAESVRWWIHHEEYTPEDICKFYMVTAASLIF